MAYLANVSGSTRIFYIQSEDRASQETLQSMHHQEECAYSQVYESRKRRHASRMSADQDLEDVKSTLGLNPPIKPCPSEAEWVVVLSEDQTRPIPVTEHQRPS